MYTCKRCGYESVHKHCLKRHLQKKKICEVAQQSETDDTALDRDVLMLQLTAHPQALVHTYPCRFCHRHFNDSSNKRKHEMVCKAREDKTLGSHSNNAADDQFARIKEDILNAIKLEMRQFVGELQQSNQSQIKALQAEMCLLRDKRNENFYQTALEQLKFPGCTHQRLRCGITDITTDELHAEIKVFDCWKEAVGQLLTYNQEMPRSQLHVYLFGKYSAECKKTAVEALTNLNIQPFEIQAVGQGIHLTNLTTGEVEVLSFHGSI